MNKDRLLSIMGRVIAVMLLAFVAVGTAVLASGKKLPFLPEIEQNYSIYAPSSEPVSDESQYMPPENSSEESRLPEKPSFKSHLNSFERVDFANISKDVLNSEKNELVLLNTKPLGDISSKTLDLQSGLLRLTDENGTRYFTDKFVEVTSILSGCTFVGERDKSGVPVIKNNAGKYFTLDETSSLKPSDYNQKKDTRGFTFEYPSYLGVQDSTLYRYLSGKNYGFRNNKGIVFNAIFKEAFAFSPTGAVCTMRTSNGVDMLFFYDALYAIINKDYYPPNDRGIWSIGYFYFDDGLTRVRKKSGGAFTECLMTEKGRLVAIPTDFKLMSYSDSVILLEKDGKFGYMSSKLEWITAPEYVSAMPFLEGLAIVGNANGKFGALDTNGEMAIPMIFDSITNCSDGLVVAYERENGYFVFAKRAK